MAEEEVQEEIKETKKKPLLKSNMVRVLLGTAIVLAILVLSFSAAYYAMKQFGGDQYDVDTIFGDERQINTPPPASIELGQFTMIITDESGRPYNLRTTIWLNVSEQRADEEDVRKEIVNRTLQLTDAVNDVLLGIDPDNFTGSSAKRREGMNELKSAVTRAINARMRNKIDGIYITEFIFK